MHFSEIFIHSIEPDITQPINNNLYLKYKKKLVAIKENIGRLLREEKINLFSLSTSYLFENISNKKFLLEYNKSKDTFYVLSPQHKIVLEVKTVIKDVEFEGNKGKALIEISKLKTLNYNFAPYFCSFNELLRNVNEGIDNILMFAMYLLIGLHQTNEDTRIEKILEENSNLREKVKELEERLETLRAKNKEQREKINRLQNQLRTKNKEQEEQINKLSSQLKAKIKKEEKDKKYNARISKMYQTKQADPGKLEEALNKIKHLEVEFSQKEKVYETRGNDLVIAHNEITRLENENENKQKMINERDKTIENQKKQIQELNRNKKFQPVEAQNISAEQMKREMQLQKDNDNLLEIIVKMKRYALREGLDFKQVEEFKDYPF